MPDEELYRDLKSPAEATLQRLTAGAPSATLTGSQERVGVVEGELHKIEPQLSEVQARKKAAEEFKARYK